MYNKIIGLGIFFWSFLAHAVIDSAPITLNVSQSRFVITLPSAPSTGYQWSVKKFDRSFLTLLSSNYVAPRSTFMGSEGQMLFTFKLIPGKPYPNTTNIFLSYERPWQPNTATRKVVTIHFSSMAN